PLLLSAISAVFESYPSEIAPFVPNEVMLRYLNAIPLPSAAEKMPFLGFLREYLHTAVTVEPTLFQSPTDGESPIGLNFNLVYRLQKPLGVITLAFAAGQKDSVPSLIWELNVRSK